MLKASIFFHYGYPFLNNGFNSNQNLSMVNMFSLLFPTLRFVNHQEMLKNAACIATAIYLFKMATWTYFNHPSLPSGTSERLMGANVCSSKSPQERLLFLRKKDRGFHEFRAELGKLLHLKKLNEKLWQFLSYLEISS